MAVSYSRHRDEHNTDLAVALNAELTSSYLCWKAEHPHNLVFESKM